MLVMDKCEHYDHVATHVAAPNRNVGMLVLDKCQRYDHVATLIALLSSSKQTWPSSRERLEMEGYSGSHDSSRETSESSSCCSYDECSSHLHQQDDGAAEVWRTSSGDDQEAHGDFFCSAADLAAARRTFLASIPQAASDCDVHPWSVPFSPPNTQEGREEEVEEEGTLTREGSADLISALEPRDFTHEFLRRALLAAGIMHSGSMES
jgi:hypothetical protein